MENTKDDLKAHLMATDAEFRKVADQHAEYHSQLEALASKGLSDPARTGRGAAAEETETTCQRPVERDHEPV